MKPTILVGGALLALALTLRSAQGQHGGGYDLTWSTIDGGGGTFSVEGRYRLGGTAGQADAGSSGAARYRVVGGLWGGISSATTATADPTPTRTGSHTPPATLTAATPPTTSPTVPPPPTTTRTATSVPGGSPTRTPVSSVTPTPVGSVAPTSTPTPTGTAATRTVPPTACRGDCDGDGAVTVDDLVTAVNIALGVVPFAACEAADGDGDEQITIDEIVAAVNRAQEGCTVPAPEDGGRRPRRGMNVDRGDER
jgi:hypothetical protein